MSKNKAEFNSKYLMKFNENYKKSLLSHRFSKLKENTATRFFRMLEISDPK